MSEPTPVSGDTAPGDSIYDDASCPTFLVSATDRHAVPALRAYRQLVAADGVASAEYVAALDHHIDYFVGWQATHGDQVMSPDQPARSAQDMSVEPGVHAAEGESEGEPYVEGTAEGVEPEAPDAAELEESQEASEPQVY